MECETCRRFPSPTRAFEELGVSVERHGTLFRCRACGGYLELIAEERAPRRLTAAQAQAYYRGVAGAGPAT